jgi:hypothetical protein
MGRPLAGWSLDRVKGVHSLLRKEPENVTGRKASAFVTVRALLGIKSIRRDAEHIVALDAHPVNDRADDGAGLERLAGLRRKGSGGFF